MRCWYTRRGCPSIQLLRSDDELCVTRKLRVDESLRGASPPAAHSRVNSRRQSEERNGDYEETASASRIQLGTENRTVVPTFSVLLMSSRPPCACTMCLTIARPRPVPPSSRERALSTR